jgi:hypothetical protein
MDLSYQKKGGYAIIKKVYITALCTIYHVYKMQKDLSQRILLRVGKSSASRNARNLAAFLALRHDIQKALDDGWTVYQIWETLNAEEKIRASYNTFNKQVKRLIMKCAQRAQPPQELNAGVSASPFPASNTIQAGKPIGFTFSSIPNKEDLL